jgi:NAD+ synthase (glutamine-hydrolysing)
VPRSRRGCLTLNPPGRKMGNPAGRSPAVSLAKRTPAGGGSLDGNGSRKGTLRLAVHQFAPRLRDVAGNAARIAATSAAVDADVLLTPELSLTGYDVGDDATALALPLVDGEPPYPQAPRGGPDVIVGLIERGRRGIAYNTAAVIRDGRLLHRHRKIYLPTYGMFDEARFFGRGGRLGVYEPAPGWRAGLLVCEDFWHPGLCYVLASAGVDLLLVQAAAPGRGVWEGSESGGRFRSADAWERIARTAAMQYGIYVALCNRTGVERGVTFAGGSIIVGPDGTVLRRADEESDVVLTADLSREELARCRRPYAHDRDDDVRLVQAELARLVPGT